MSLSLFFPKTITPKNFVNSDILTTELADFSATLVTVVLRDEDFILVFEEDELTEEQSSSLMSIISNHAGVPPVSVVTPRQIRLALVMVGISLSTIDATIDSLNEPDKSIARITWEYSTEIDRNHPLIDSLAPLLGLSIQQIDDLFALASAL